MQRQTPTGRTFSCRAPILAPNLAALSVTCNLAQHRQRCCRAVLKSRTETEARKKDSVIFVLISRTNFSRNFVRVLCARVRDFSALTMQLNAGKGLKTNKCDSGI